MQLTVPLGSHVLLSMFSALAVGSVVPRAVFVVYTGEARDRWGAVQDELTDKNVAHGVPVFAVDMRNVRVNAANLHSEEKLTAQLYLVADSYLVASAGYRDMQGISTKAHLTNIGVKQVGELEGEMTKLPPRLSMGVGVFHDAIAKVNRPWDMCL